MKRLLMLAAAGAALGLAACEEGAARRNASGGGGGGLCKAFAATPAAPAAPGAPVAGDPAAAVDDCLHRWGYTLARADDDSADVVADAVVAACAAPLARWNQQSLGMAAASGSSAPAEAPSLLTGEPTTPIRAHAEFAAQRSLFYVVQGRAGKCAPPRTDDRDDDDRARPVSTAGSPDP